MIQVQVNEEKHLALSPSQSGCTKILRRAQNDTPSESGRGDFAGHGERLDKAEPNPAAL
jgi:hypothetical protein